MKTIIVVGNGMVGYKFCEKFVAQADSSKYKLVVFGEEPRVAYDRVHLSEFFEDGDAERLSLAPRSWYEENGIELHTSVRISEINKTAKTVSTSTDTTFTYDHLVLATGSVPFVPPIRGVEKKGV